MCTELQLNLIDVYRELINIIDNFYSEHRKGWTTADIAKAILEVKQNKFSDEELKPEYDNMLALRNYVLKRSILENTWPFRFYIMKTWGVARTIIILDKALGEEKQVEIKMPHNINRLQFNSKLVRYITSFETDIRVALHIKSLEQLHQDYILIESALNKGLLKIYEDNILLDTVDIYNRFEEIENGRKTS